jgi:hypothetical protein
MSVVTEQNIFWRFQLGVPERPVDFYEIFVPTFRVSLKFLKPEHRTIVFE